MNIVRKAERISKSIDAISTYIETDLEDLALSMELQDWQGLQAQIDIMCTKVEDLKKQVEEVIDTLPEEELEENDE